MKPKTPVRCVVSKRYRFICLLIAKNASSTLAGEFGRDIYESYRQRYAEVDQAVRDAYFTFAPVRDPVSRLLSAYQEVSFRFETKPMPAAERPFLMMDDTPGRFAAFLEAAEEPGWDPHLVPQVRYLDGVRVDLFARVERLQDAIGEMCRRLDIGDCPILPVRRSRVERKQVYAYDRFLVDKRGLDAATVARIERIYDADVRLYESLFRDGGAWALSDESHLRNQASSFDAELTRSVRATTTAPHTAEPSKRDRDGYPEQSRYVKVRRLGDQTIVISRLNRRQVSLNPTGAAIWSLCDGETSVAAICAALSARFGVDGAIVRADVMSTLEQLENFGVVKLRGSPLRRRGTRRIDLREIPFYVINCRDDAVRRDFMRRQLARLGLRYEFVDAMVCSGGIGTAISHLRVLNRQDVRPPFAVLEDDCVFNESFRYEFTLPSSADAYYLGVSHFGIEQPGRLSWGRANRVKWRRYDRNSLRVFNMLSTHGILYLSERFRVDALHAIVDALCNPSQVFPGDVGLASIQPDHIVLTPYAPICYQAAELGGHQDATRRALTELR